MSKIDFEQDQTEVLTKTKEIKSLSDQVLKLRELEDDYAQSEKALKDKQKEIDRISQDVIPTLLGEMGLSSLKLADGSAVDVKPFYRASIAVKNRDAAYKWLRENGLGDIIKNDVTVSFGKNLAKSQGFQPTQKLKVEPMTLKALVRERIEKGEDMPMDIFNVFVGNQTKLTRKN
mgnify:CR=1 FL=1